MKLYVPIERAAQVERLLGEMESSTLDFKKFYAFGGCGIDGVGQDKIDKDRLEIARDIAQFCNSEGGTLLVGMAEDDEGTPRHTKAVETFSVRNIDGLLAFVEERISANLEPSVRVDPRVIDMANGDRLVAINVDPTEDVVAVYDKNVRTGKVTIEYLRRTSVGKEWMKPYEVEHLMSKERRAMYLRLRRLRTEVGGQRVALMPQTIGVNEFGKFEPITEGQHPVYMQEVVSPDHFTLVVFHRPNREDSQKSLVDLPYSMVDDAWITTDGEIEGQKRLALSLTHKLIRGGQPPWTFFPWRGH